MSTSGNDVTDQIAQFIGAVALGLKREIVPEQLDRNQRSFLHRTSFVYPGVEDQIKATHKAILGIAEEKGFDPSLTTLLASRCLSTFAGTPHLWPEQELPKNMRDSEAIERAGCTVIAGVLNFVNTRNDVEWSESLHVVRDMYRLPLPLRVPVKPPPAAPLPYNIRKMRKTAKALTRIADHNARTWKAGPKSTARASARHYFVTLGAQLMQEAQKGGVARFGLQTQDHAFFEQHPSAVAHFNHIAHAIDAMITGPEMRGWARTTRVDLDNPDTARKLFGKFAARFNEILWDKGFYPSAKGVQTPRTQEIIESALVTHMLDCLEADKKFIFAGLFPRNRRGIAATPRPA